MSLSMYFLLKSKCTMGLKPFVVDDSGLWPNFCNVGIVGLVLQERNSKAARIGSIHQEKDAFGVYYHFRQGSALESIETIVISMKKLNLKALVLTAAPLLTAFAAVLAALLGQNGISSLLGTSATDQNQSSSEPSLGSSEVKIRFYCHESAQNLATVVENSKVESQIKIINWNVSNKYFGDDWSPEKRCRVVSERFQAIYNRNKLAYLTVDDAHWLGNKAIPIICGVQEKGITCKEEDLLFTLENQDDPNAVLAELVAIRQDPQTNKALLRGDEQSFEDGVRIYYDLTKLLRTSSSGELNESEQEPAF